MSPSSIVMSIQTVLIALIFTRSLPSNFVLVTLMIFLKTCPHGLLFISMRDDESKTGAFSGSRYRTIMQQLVVLVTLMTTTVYLLGQNRARHNDDNSGALSDSRCHTILQYLTYETFCLEHMMLAYMFWLVRHLLLLIYCALLILNPEKAAV